MTVGLMHSKLKVHLELQVLMPRDYEIITGKDTVRKVMH